MPTTPQRTPPPLRNSSVLLAAAGYAASELALTLGLGGFFDWGRAEALLFFAFRPWLLLALALLLARRPLRTRVAAYALALLAAAASETLLLLGLGAADPWPEMLRGLAGGTVLLLAIDVALQAAQHFFGRWGRGIAALLLAILFLTPFALRPYEAILLDRGGSQAGQRPDLMLMTALPIIWGEGGGFDPESRPAAAYEALQREFTVRPLDYLDAKSLDGRLLLLAQPRALAPAELAALDDWVRRGGRALILTDPALVWPTELPLGDIRRPPPVGLLGPLLGHWVVELEPPVPTRRAVADILLGEKKLRLASPGRFHLDRRGCGLEADGLIADCPVGQGRALLIADADLVDDRLWAGPAGSARHSRLADNPLVLADLLDRLVGIRRDRAAREVEWLAPDAQLSRALLLALLPLALLFGAALILRLRGGR